MAIEIGSIRQTVLAIPQRLIQFCFNILPVKIADKIF